MTFRKIKSYIINGLSAILKPKKVFNRPLHIQLELTTYCNLSCPSCPRDVYVKKPANMPFNDFKKIVDILHPVNITLSGLGEPTINPDLFKMISYAKENKIDINTTSNFVNIKEKHLEGFTTSGLNLLNISIDAASKETYLKIRLNNGFDTIINNIKRLVELKTTLNSKTPYLRLTFVVQDKNIHEMIEFYYLAKDIGANSVLYQIFMDDDVYKRRYLIKGVDSNILQKRIEELIKLEKKFNQPTTNALFLKQQFLSIKDIYAGKKVNLVKKCIKPWISLYITVEGDIRPCCSFGAKKKNMGNIFNTKDIMEIFNRDEYQKFREKLKSGIIPDAICASCIPESAIDVVKRTKWTPNFIISKT